MNGILSKFVRPSQRLRRDVPEIHRPPVARRGFLATCGALVGLTPQIARAERPLGAVRCDCKIMGGATEIQIVGPGQDFPEPLRPLDPVYAHRPLIELPASDGHRVRLVPVALTVEQAEAEVEHWEKFYAEEGRKPWPAMRADVFKHVA